MNRRIFSKLLSTSLFGFFINKTVQANEEPNYDVKLVEEDKTSYYKSIDGVHKLHRLDGPAVERTDGTKEWYQSGQRHRLDGPAIEYTSGKKEWYQNGQRHRLDGPAVEYASGSKEWFQKGQRHRLDGPAIESANGDKYWCQNGLLVSKWSACFLKRSNLIN